MADENSKPFPPPVRPGVLATVTKNAFANLARIGATWVVLLFLPPLLVRVLDKPAYATWVLILQIAAYVLLVDNGIQSAIGRFASRADQSNDRGAMQETLSNAALILLIAALIAAAATLLCSWQLDRIFTGIPSAIVAAAQKALIVIGLSLALSLPFSTFAGAFLGLQRNEVNALAAGAGKLLGAAGAAWAAWRHQGLFVMALWIAAGNVLQSLIFFAASLRRGLHRFLHREYISGPAMRQFVRFCSAMFATQLGSLLITGMDMPVVAAFDFHAAAYYAVAATASSMLAAPQGAIVNPLIPVAAGMSDVRAPQGMGETLIRSTRYANAVLCLLTLPLLFAMYPFLRLWVGSDYAVHALPLALILIVAQFVRLTLVSYAAIGFAAGQQERMLISPLGEGVVNLGCSVLGAIELGALGVALGTLIGAFVGVALHFVNSMPRTDSMRFSRRRLLIVGIARPVACCLPALVFLLLLVPRAGIPASLALVAIGETVAAIMIWKGNFSSDERMELKALARRIFANCFRLAKAEAQ